MKRRERECVVVLRADWTTMTQAGHFMPNAVTKNAAVVQTITSLLGEAHPGGVRAAAARAVAALCANKECSDRLASAGALVCLLDMASGGDPMQ